MKVNNYFWIFLGIFGASIALILAASEKYLPFLFHKTVYLCKHVIEAVPIKPLQGNFQLIALSILMIFFGYIAIKLILMIVSVVKQKRELAAKIIVSDKILTISEKLSLQNEIIVIKDDRLLAFCFGFTKQKIYLSTKLIEQLNINELETVIRHEMYHLTNQDIFVMIMARLGELLFPFLPFISDLVAKYAIQREVEADIFAHTNDSTRKKFLVSVLTKFLNQDPQQAYLFVANLGEYETLEVRINHLLGRTSLYPRISSKNLLVSIFSLLIFGILLVMPVKAIEYHTQGQDAVMACIDPFRVCNQACERNAVLSNSEQNTSHLNSSSAFPSSRY